MTASSSQDRFSHLMGIANTISEQVANLAEQAHTEGVRDGMEFAAKICGAIADEVRNKPINNDLDCASIATAEFLRDNIRLTALTVEKEGFNA